MKKLILHIYWLVLPTTIVTLSGCDPTDKEIFNTERVQLKATIHNGGEVKRVGDTITIRLRIPDTVVSNTRTVPVRTIDQLLFMMYIQKYDTVRRRADLVPRNSFWTTKGTNHDFVFQPSRTTKPFELEIKFVPPEKGIYSFELSAAPGEFDVNGNYEGRLLIDFDVPDKHYRLLSIVSPYFGGQSYYDAIVQRGSEGLGVYFFKVE